MLPVTEVIVPTMASAARADSLRTALHTITSQQGVRAVPLVVVNGNRVDETLYSELQHRRDIRLFRREQPSAPAAVHFGVQQVTSETYACLDDDDELLPGGLASRLRVLDTEPRVDVVATNGLLNAAGTCAPLNTDAEMASFRADPLLSLLQFNWLASCGAQFRTASVGAEYFDPSVQVLEWTYLAFRLAQTRQVRFIDDLTFRIHRTDGSASQSAEYYQGVTVVLKRMLSESMDASFTRGVRRKYAASLHAASMNALAGGERIVALRWFARCLATGTGLRYLPALRRLLVAS